MVMQFLEEMGVLLPFPDEVLMQLDMGMMSTTLGIKVEMEL